MPSDQFEQRIRERFRNAELPPRPEVWDALEGRLKGEDKRKPIAFWWKLSGIAAGILLLLFAGYHFFSPPNLVQENGLQAVENMEPVPDAHLNKVPTLPKSQEREGESIPPEANSPELANAESTVSLEKEEVNHIPVQVKEEPENPTQESWATIESPKTGPIEQNPIDSAILNAGSTMKEPTAELEKFDNISTVNLSQVLVETPVLEGGTILIDPIAPVPTLPVVSSSPRSWAVSMYIRPEGTEIASTPGIRLPQVDLIPSKLLEANDASFADLESEFPDNSLPGQNNSPSDTLVQRFQYPSSGVSLGARIEYALGNRWSIQSGVGIYISNYGEVETQQVVVYNTDSFDYSQLQNTQVDRFRTVQIEVPLYLSYALIQGRSSLNISGGVSLYRRINQRLQGASVETVNLVRSPNFVNSPSHRIEEIRNRDFSLSAGLRLLYQYQISPKVGIYMGPHWAGYAISPTYTLQGVSLSDDQMGLGDSNASTITNNKYLHRLGWEMGVQVRLK